MPKIAVIADIHANRFALDAVVEDLADREVDEVIVAGDLVGRGPQGTSVVERIAGLQWPCVRGNHEDYLLSFYHGDIPDNWRHEEQWAASRWMARELGPEAAEFIDELPFSRHSEVDDALQIFHGSPNSHSEGIGPWLDDEDLESMLETIDGSVLVCAHTHRPLEYDGEAGKVVNVGSVGLPFNGDWRAQYAIFERTDESDDWDVTFRRVRYPRHKLIEHYEESGFLEEGRITARLLYREVKQARPFLVPFLKWADVAGRAPTGDNLAEFLDLYDPSESMGTFFQRLRDYDDRPAPSS